MKNELVKALAMVTMVLVLALGSAVASGQPQSANKVVANIPFEFNIGYLPQ